MTPVTGSLNINRGPDGLNFISDEGSKFVIAADAARARFAGWGEGLGAGGTPIPTLAPSTR
jgi:hypothetical protein